MCPPPTPLSFSLSVWRSECKRKDSEFGGILLQPPEKVWHVIYVPTQACEWSVWMFHVFLPSLWYTAANICVVNMCIFRCGLVLLDCTMWDSRDKPPLLWLRVSQKWSGITALNNINKGIFKSFAGYTYTEVVFTLFVSILKERPVTCFFPSNDTSHFKNISAALLLHCHKPQNFVRPGINFLPQSEELSAGKCDISDSKLSGLTYLYNTADSDATQVPMYWTSQNCKLTGAHFINSICNS